MVHVHFEHVSGVETSDLSSILIDRRVHQPGLSGRCAGVAPFVELVQLWAAAVFGVRQEDQRVVCGKKEGRTRRNGSFCETVADAAPTSTSIKVRAELTLVATVWDGDTVR
jgi:hypothetical protein